MIQLEELDGKKYVNADITIATEEDGEEVANTYADKLKEEYPDHVIDIIIIYEDDVLFNDVIE